MPTKNEFFPDMVFPPGETLEEKLNEMEMSKKEFAIRTGKPEKTIIAIIKGKSSITKDMAIKFENVTKISASFWIRKQSGYDEFIAREKRKIIIEQAIEWTKMFPYAAMAKNSWLPKTRKIEEKAENLLTFFHISEHTAWEKIFLKKQLKVAFRISLAHTQEAHAISAWLQQGQNKANGIKTPEYDKNKFQLNLKKIKKIMAKQPKDFFQELQNLCLEAGVLVIHTPNLPKAPIHGQNDRFWFTFFHEAGHIILHGKKFISIENKDFIEIEPQKEEEANKFAVKWTLSKEQEEEIMKNKIITEQNILDYAKKFGTHPAIIIGRLQHLGIISYSVGRQFIEPIKL